MRKRRKTPKKPQAVEICETGLTGDILFSDWCDQTSYCPALLNQLTKKGYLSKTDQRGVYHLTEKGKLKVVSYYAEQDNSIKSKEQLLLFLLEHGGFCKSMTGTSGDGNSGISGYHATLRRKGLTCVNPDDIHQWRLTEKGVTAAKMLKKALPTVSKKDHEKRQQIRDSILIANQSEYVPYSLVAQHYKVSRQRIYQIKQDMDLTND